MRPPGPTIRPSAGMGLRVSPMNYAIYSRVGSSGHETARPGVIGAGTYPNYGG